MLFAFVRFLWEGYERLFVRFAVLDAVEPEGDNLIFVRLIRYRGEPVTLPDGTTLKAGDWAGEIHFHSHTLANFHPEREYRGSTTKLAVVTLRRTRQSLRHLAQYVSGSEKYRPAQVFFGKTLLYRGAQGLGFTVTELPSGREKLFLLIYLRWLLVVYHPKGWGRLSDNSAALVPKGVWISRKQLLQEYLEDT